MDAATLSIVKTLIEAGVLGVMLAVFIVMYTRQQKLKDQIQEKRVKDAQSVTDQLLKMSNDNNEILQKLHATMIEMTAALNALREHIRDRRSQ